MDQRDTRSPQSSRYQRFFAPITAAQMSGLPSEVIEDVLEIVQRCDQQSVASVRPVILALRCACEPLKHYTVERVTTKESRRPLHATNINLRYAGRDYCLLRYALDVSDSPGHTIDCSFTRAEHKLLASLERARELMRAFAEALSQIDTGLDSEQRAPSRTVAELFAAQELERNAARQRRYARLVAKLQAAVVALIKASFARPGANLDAWVHLARAIKVDPAEMAAVEIVQHAMAWIDREKLRAKLLANALRDGKAVCPLEASRRSASRT
jgi:hypothetical protein